MSNLGRLLPSDEGLNHQTVETFATISHSDPSWTEKLWASIFATDGSLQVDVGLGKYMNRNIMDGFAGVSRGREQWTVRSSRELGRDPESCSVGPIRYEVVRPLRTVRFSLAPNEAAAIAFELEFEGVLPPFLEERDRKRVGTGFRVFSDTLRYHQPSTVTGWVEVEGVRRDVGEGWLAFRDHSWGVRMDVGAPPTDLAPGKDLSEIRYRMQWSPMLLWDADGAAFELHHYLQGVGSRLVYSSGHLNRPDGSQERAWHVDSELMYEPETRRLLGGVVSFDMESGARRTVELEAVGDTGFHLGAGLYLGLDGQRHGMWRGPSHLEGEHVEDCTEPTALRRLHQLRDCIVKVREGEASGFGVFETIVTGAWPDAGLGEDSFL